MTPEDDQIICWKLLKLSYFHEKILVSRELVSELC